MVTARAVTASGLSNIRHGMDLLDTPVLNKGTAFTEEERMKFGLHGLFPPQVETLDEQVTGPPYPGELDFSPSVD